MSDMDFNVYDNKSRMNNSEQSTCSSGVSEQNTEDAGNKFLFSNGKTIDLKDVHKGIKANNTLLKKYDKNNNSVFDLDELAAIRQDLNSGKLSEAEEISLYSGITGLSLESSKSEFQASKASEFSEPEIRENQ
jgi:hypothetical protein